MCVDNLLSVNGLISIYRDVEAGNKKPTNLADLRECALLNAEMALKAILNGDLAKIDPIVGENGCQIRALNVILAYLNPNIIAEVTELLPKVQARPAPELILVSSRVDYLIRAHLLTIGKYFSMGLDGHEESGLKLEIFKKNLKVNITKNFFYRLIRLAQSRLSEDSVVFIQSINPMTQLKCVREITLGGKKLQSTCAFYNLIAVMLQICDLQLPILVKEHNGSREMYFKSEMPGSNPVLYKEILRPKQAILVIEVFFAQSENLAKSIEYYGLVDVVVANGAMVPQYTIDDDVSTLDAESQKQIAFFQQYGPDLSKRTFKIAHIHAATVQEEKAEI